jgi:hypothetical protein
VQPEALSIIRTQQDVPGGNGTRIYVCVIDAARQTINVLSLSSTVVTYVGDLQWPTLASLEVSDVRVGFVHLQPYVRAQGPDIA